MQPASAIPAVLDYPEQLSLLGPGSDPRAIRPRQPRRPSADPPAARPFPQPFARPDRLYIRTV